MLHRQRKILLAVALGAAAVMVLIALRFTSGGQYRSLLQDHVAAASGYELILAGEVDLDLLPSARLTLTDVRLRNPGLPQELASAATIQLGLDRGDLLRGELTIRELRIDGFQINALVTAAGDSIWRRNRPNAMSATPAAVDTTAPLPARIVAQGGRLDLQNLSTGRRAALKNLRIVSEGTNAQGRAFSAQASFDVEWFDNANRQLRDIAVGFTGDIEADLDAGGLTIADINLNSTPVLLQGRFEANGLPDNARYAANLTSNEFDAKLLLRNLGWLPAPAHPPSVIGSGGPEESWPSMLEFELSGDGGGLALAAAVSTPERRVIDADAEIRFADGLAPVSVRYGVDIGELDVGALFAGDDAAEPAGGRVAAMPRHPSPRLGRALPGLENLLLSGSITADVLRAGDLRVTNLSIFTNTEDRVFDLEIPPVAALGGTLSANMRWSAATGALLAEARGENLAGANIATLVPRFDILGGRLLVDAELNAVGGSWSELLADIGGEVSFSVTENLIDIGLVKQIFTSISALSPTGEAIQQWPDLIHFSEVEGKLTLDGGVDNEHSFELRMDNFSASGSGIADPRAGRFDYSVLLTMLGEPFNQTIPVSPGYQDIDWPVECAAAFADEVSRFCRPDFNAVREIFAGIGADAGSN